MRYPYVGSENRGILLYSRERLHEMIKSGHEHGYQLEVHAIGDLAAEVTYFNFQTNWFISITSQIIINIR
jgi:predicted amidohydrolase YtcJ